jgi:formiminotetrahydrofolate cyclodeaminase
MLDSSLDTYLAELASKASTPGGGAVAAVTGAQAAALISMVCHLTKDGGDDLTKIRSRSESARIAFIKLGEADIAGFDLVMMAYKLPGKSQTEKEIRQAALQPALLAAASAPLSMLELAASLVTDIQVLVKTGNPNLITDVGIAALLIPATVQAATMNVLINLRSMKDASFKQAALASIDGASTKSRVLVKVSSDISRLLNE